MAEQDMNQKEDIEEAVEDMAENMQDSADDEAVNSGEAEISEEEADAAEDAEPKKGFFGKAKKEKKDKKDIQIEELTDKYKRTFAEFDNFRKRTEKEMLQQKDFGAKMVVEKILPIIDNFERGLATLSEEEKQAPFADGMDKVYKQLVKAMEELGVTPIEAVGKEFDPNFHNAVMRGEDEELGENIVSEEFLKGYMYRDSVVRHSMVKVVNC